MAQKIKNDELESLKELVGKETQIVNQIGLLEAEKHSGLHALAQVRDDLQKKKVEIEDKYGKISINLEDGSYEEIQEEE
jgi:hypothetical protein